MDKNILNVLAEIDEINPYATFLDQSTLSSVTDYIDTGSMPLNAVISGSLYGGIPRNRLTMLCGESMTGKTYIVIRTLANAQKKGLIPVIFDTENAIDRKTAENLGLDITKVKYVPCFNIEETRNSIYKFLTKAKENKIEDKFIVAIDSIGNLENALSLKRMVLLILQWIWVHVLVQLNLFSVPAHNLLHLLRQRLYAPTILTMILVRCMILLLKISPVVRV